MTKYFTDLNDRNNLISACQNALVIWDFDGVVSDTEPTQAKSYKIILKDDYIIDFNLTNFIKYVGSTEDTIWAGLLREYKLEANIAELKEKRKAIFLELAKNELKPSWLIMDLAEEISTVSSRQILLSNGDPETIRYLLNTWGLSAYLEYIQNNIGDNKSNRIKAMLASSPKTVVIEDNEEYLNLAHSLGAYTVQVSHSFSRPFAENLADINETI
jgi:beta-phosphoglucomutase-like phosphatase (HAD superfamily)